MKAKSVALKLFCLSIIALVVISCVPQSKIKYLQDKSGAQPVTNFQNSSTEYKIRTGDYLYIRILTLDPKSNEIFSNITGSGTAGVTAGSSEQDLYISGYQVSDSGYINFPLLGNINAKGQTVEEIEVSLNKSVSEIVKEASVRVKLVLFNISILGEVKVPGKYSVNKGKINILEALAMAGDLTTFANRGKVQVIRNEGNVNNVVTLNLLSKEILNSPYYYLQPNDIIYVEPMKSKIYAFDTFPYSLVFSTIGLILVIGTYFK